MPFEVLDFPFMLLGRRPRLEGSEVPASPFWDSFYVNRADTRPMTAF